LVRTRSRTRKTCAGTSPNDVATQLIGPNPVNTFNDRSRLPAGHADRGPATLERRLSAAGTALVTSILITLTVYTFAPEHLVKRPKCSANIHVIIDRPALWLSSGIWRECGQYISLTTGTRYIGETGKSPILTIEFQSLNNPGILLGQIPNPSIIGT
jgi:hypothetical protein